MNHEIIAAYQAGTPVKQILSTFKLRSNILTQILKENGVKLRHPNMKKYGKEKKEEVVEYCLKCNDIGETCKVYGVTRKTLKKWLVDRQISLILRLPPK